MYNGICIVHARYEGKKSNETKIYQNKKSPATANNSIESLLTSCEELGEKKHDDKQKSIKIKDPMTVADVTNDFLIDFYNYAPTRFRIQRGIGFIRIINGRYYVVTCNHIMIKNSIYTGYISDVKKKTIKFDMTICHRIPEIDLVILEIKQPVNSGLKEIIFTKNNIKPIYYESEDNKNVILTGEYIPSNSFLKKQNELQYSFLNVESNVEYVFENLDNKIIQQLPLLSIPIDKLDPVKKLIAKFKINLKDDLKEMNEKRRFITKIIGETISGISGSIICCGGINVGMISIYTHSNSDISVKALPLFLIDQIVQNVIKSSILLLKSIQIYTDPYKDVINNEMYNYHMVIKKTCQLYNGKKFFTFNEGNVIMEVDSKKFNNDHLLYSDVVRFYVPLNTYMFLKSVFYPDLPIPIKIAKRTLNGSTDRPDISLPKIRVHNLMGIPYNDMYRIRIFTKIYEWNNLIFMELSNEIIEWYNRMGKPIIDDIVSDKNEGIEASANNERIVIMFNHKNINIHKLKNESLYTELINLPYQRKNPEAQAQTETEDQGGQYYFLTIGYVGQKRIINLDELKSALQSINTSNQQKISRVIFKLTELGNSDEGSSSNQISVNL